MTMKMFGIAVVVGLGLYFGIIQMLFAIVAAVLYWGGTLFIALSTI